MSNSHDVLERAIAKLSVLVNVSAGITHPMDDSRAKELFKALRAKGISCSHGDVHRIAVANDWSDRHATALAKLADKIDGGGRVQIPHKSGWGEKVVSELLS
ncbi:MULTISPECIES: DUF1889 family protein [unclassified Aeromonas]|uniref:DUF1889 family protein n=1 Tax=unclassified Aeromonas TaxID=257493 RepID=UPI0023DD9361|nr:MULTISPECIES: DUF1889 family protein [unclassified Aeromonas]MCX7132507.1 DUF1889 family protein [Aeromonas sp.]MDF2415417.1 DUF1889 family protein [Aeromonas sp. 1HA1]